MSDSSSDQNSKSIETPLSFRDELRTKKATNWRMIISLLSLLAGIAFIIITYIYSQPKKPSASISNTPSVSSVAK